MIASASSIHAARMCGGVLESNVYMVLVMAASTSLLICYLDIFSHAPVCACVTSCASCPVSLQKT